MSSNDVKKPAAGSRGKPAGKSAGKSKKNPPKGAAKGAVRKAAPRQPPGKSRFSRALGAAAKKLAKADAKKLLLKAFPYLLFGYFGNKAAYAYRVTDAPDIFSRLAGWLSHFGAAFENILPSLHPHDLLIGAASGAGVYLAVYLKGRNAKKFRKGAEYGSAR